MKKVLVIMRVGDGRVLEVKVDNIKRIGLVEGEYGKLDMLKQNGGRVVFNWKYVMSYDATETNHKA